MNCTYSNTRMRTGRQPKGGIPDTQDRWARAASTSSQFHRARKRSSIFGRVTSQSPQNVPHPNRRHFNPRVGRYSARGLAASPFVFQMPARLKSAPVLSPAPLQNDSALIAEPAASTAYSSSVENFVRTPYTASAAGLEETMKYISFPESTITKSTVNISGPKGVTIVPVQSRFTVYSP